MAPASAGGRTPAPALPPALVVMVHRPGALTVACGSGIIARLDSGQVSGPSMDVFESKWLSFAFRAARDEIARLHQLASKEAGETGRA